MLDGLEPIAWTDVHHAYGPAADVPKLLHYLVSPNQKVRSSAIDKLHENIWHQGTVYEATPSAVPFLLELLDAAGTPSRPSIANKLALIPRGRSYQEVHAPSKKKAVERSVSMDRDRVPAVPVRMLRSGARRGAGVGVVPRRHYGHAAIAMPLTLWTVVREPARRFVSESVRGSILLDGNEWQVYISGRFCLTTIKW